MVIKHASIYERPSGAAFSDLILRLGGSDKVAHWRLDSVPTGVAEEQVSASNMNGTFGGVTWGVNEIGPSSLRVARFDGTNSYVDIYSAALNSAIDLNNFTVSIWAKVYDVGCWTDSTARQVVLLKTDANNYISIGKSASDDVITFEYDAQSTKDTVNFSTLIEGESPLDYMHLALTVSTTEMIAYVDSVPSAIQTGLGVWAGALNSDNCVVGSSAVASPADVWNGNLAELTILSKVLTPDEVLKVFRNP